MKKHVNIPIFIPHIGCSNGCVFCNQRKISGHAGFVRERACEELRRAFTTIDGSVPVQIAYFGGSFTGIDREDMRALLKLAYAYVEEGRCDSIRVSTRPDYIDRGILEELSAYRVKTVELGVQSMDDGVLAASERGHTARDTERAFSLLGEYGIEAVGQMMIGLPESDREKEVFTAVRIADMGAVAARIYPTVVFEGTRLCEMMRSGRYLPLDEEAAVSRSAAALSVFTERRIPVIRLGLQSTELLDAGDGIVGGFYHPALGEKVMGRFLRERVQRMIGDADVRGKTLTLRVCPSDVSAFIGQKGINRTYFTEHYALGGFRVIPDGTVKKYECSISFSEQ